MKVHRRFTFATTLTVEQAAPLIARGHRVGYCGVRAFCIGLVQWSRTHLGYALKFRILRNDQSVTYYRSEFNGLPCYLIVRGLDVFVWTGAIMKSCTRFQDGHDTWNKGRKGWSAAGTERTRFKPGVLRGRAAQKYRLLGTVLLRRDKRGNKRRYIKVRDTGPKRYISLAQWIWEQANGPVPPGSIVVHKDGHSLGDRLGNLLCLTRAEHIERLKSKHGYRFRYGLRRAHGAIRRKWAEKRETRRLIRENMAAVRTEMLERIA